MSERSEAMEPHAVNDASPSYPTDSADAAPDDMPPGYKRTEVGVIPEDWDVETIGAIFHASAGGDFKPWRSSREFRDECRYPIYANAIQNKGLYGYANYATAKSGSITITARGTLGRAEFRTSPFVAIGRLLVLEPERECEGLYFSEYINFGISFSIESTGVPQLTAPQVAKYHVPVPPVKEQRAIANALSDADALIESLDRLIAKKRAIKQAAMQQLLTGETRLPGFSGPWEKKQLGDYCRLKSGESITSSKITDHSQYPCYGGNGFRGFTNTFTHEGNYALIGRQGALCGNVLQVSGKFFASEHALVVAANTQTDISWLAVVLERMKLNQYSESSAQPGLSARKLLLLEVYGPNSKKEQSAIATLLSDMDAEIQALELRRNKARKIKQGMMQQLLTGRVRLVEPSAHKEFAC